MAAQRKSNILDIVSTNHGTPGDTATQTVQPGRRGRPRSARVRVAVVRAAAELTLAGGPAAATVDAIATRAAVSRTTIYEWWPTSAAIVLEGLLDAVADPIIAPPGSSSKEGARAPPARAERHPHRHRVAGRCSATWSRRRPAHPAMARAVRDQWLHPRRAAVAAVVRQAVAEGEIRAGTDVDVIVDALVSPPYYRLLFALSPLDDAALIDLLETVWRGCRRSAALPVDGARRGVGAAHQSFP